MKKAKKLANIFTAMILLVSMLSSCSEMPTATIDGTQQVIPYSESKMAEFSKEFRETNELYIESDNAKRKTVIDVQSGNSYEEVLEPNKVRKIYFLNQPDGVRPKGVYDLFENNGVRCYCPIEGDSTIDIYELLASMGNSKTGTVQISYDGANRVETIRSGEETRTMIFWGETSIPIGAGRKNDMEDFTIFFTVIAKQIPDAEMKATLENGLRGYSLYTPPNPYA